MNQLHALRRTAASVSVYHPQEYFMKSDSEQSLACMQKKGVRKSYPTRRDRYEGSSADDGEALHSLMIRDATTKNLFLAVNFRPYMIEKHQLDMLLNCSEYSGRKSAYDGDSR
eukprot:m.61351 g.61351  ORF g.61351 m.61351 type:complete len:113 (+) comp15759_c0_seq8:19-357(+)